MIDVATHAGLAKGTLYLHFPDKEALFENVFEQLISESMVKSRPEPPLSSESARERLKRTFLLLLADFEESGKASVLRLIIAEGSRFPALAAVHQRLVIDPLIATINDALESELVSSRSQLLRQFPFILSAPIIAATIYNELWSRGSRVDASEATIAFLDLIFAPA